MPETVAADFETLYRGASPVPGMEFDTVPWDIGEPQPAVVEFEGRGQVSGDVLDAGCGAGENAIFLAARGHRVTGVDIAPTAIEWARQRSRDRGAEVEYAVADVTDLGAYDRRFDTIIDSAVFDCLDAEQRDRYAAALHRAARPGAKLFIVCFSDALPVEVPGVFTISAETLRTTLEGAGWTITALRADAFLVTATANEFFRSAGLHLDTDDRGRGRLPAWAVEAVRS
ncbi:class I SAM-dependent methyltransferase [Nonomuraea africana]|uniref:class I SAM-dependent methyltransferase n=1 Tax=Nonomuraea africana TaxID=46171 RepID=UPI0033F92432